MNLPPDAVQESHGQNGSMPRRTNMIELTRFQLIQRLCSDAAKDICITADGGILGGVGYGDSRLFENGIYFHDLNKEELVAAIVGLTGVMSPAVNITYVSRDQVYLCAWCAQVFSDSNTSLRHEIKNEVLYFMRLVAHTALSRFNPDYFSNVPINIGVHSRSKRINRFCSWHCPFLRRFFAFVVEIS